jgi:predicted transcriptional regulator
VWYFDCGIAFGVKPCYKETLLRRETMMAASETIKKIRQSLLLTTREFADRVGISAHCVSLYEHGKRNPRYNILRRIKKLADENNLAIKAEDFFDK